MCTDLQRLALTCTDLQGLAETLKDLSMFYVIVQRMKVFRVLFPYRFENIFTLSVAVYFVMKMLKVVVLLVQFQYLATNMS